MSDTHEYYKIERKGDFFTAVTTADTFQFAHNILFSEAVQDLKQYGLALITTEADGLHSVYLPRYNRTLSTELIISGITDYQYFRQMLLLKKDDYFIFLNIASTVRYFHDDEIAIEQDNNRHQKLYVKNLVPREDISVCKAIVCTGDGVDYLITRTHPVEVIKLGKAVSLPGKFGYIKVISENCEYICNGENFTYTNKPILTCTSVDSFSDEENERISILFYSDSKYYGYYFKDSDGNIIGASIFRENDYTFICKIKLEKPAKTLRFISHFWPDKKAEYRHIELWKVSFVDGDEKIFVDSTFGQYFVDL